MKYYISNNKLIIVSGKHCPSLDIQLILIYYTIYQYHMKLNLSNALNIYVH